LIDLYCERLGPGLSAEPINAITNLAFLVAALAAWSGAHQKESLTAGNWVLIGLMVSIGMGSGLFHTFATSWARILDILPILFFQMAYLWLYGRRVIRLQTSYLVASVVLFIIAAYFGRQFPHILNGLLIYAPAFTLLLGLGIYHFRYAKNQRSILLWATGVFSISLFFRTIDQVACPYITVGTHFFWHLFNGLLVYMAFRGLLMNTSVAARSRT